MALVPGLALMLALSSLMAGAADAPYEIELADVAPDACPAQGQLGEALEARMPGVVARGAHEPSANTLRLALSLSPEGVTRVTMTDGTGALRLERDLELPKVGAGAAREPHDRVASCAALAETVALIVERYLRHLGYHEPPPPALVAPPPPPPPPPPATTAAPQAPLEGPFRLGLGLAARPPLGASWRLEPQLALAARVGHLDIDVAAGVSLAVDETVPQSTGGTLSLRTFPARVAVGWAFPLDRRISLVPGVAAGFDFVLAETHGLESTRRSTALEPTLEAGARLLVALTQRVWLDLRAFEGIDVRPEEFSISLDGTNTSETVSTTPRTYTRVAVDFGVYLGKN